MTLTEVRQLLAELDIRPSKALGQNFLIDGNILRILIEQADLRRDESVLEIGPGLGVLTVELVARAKRVVAIEKDPRLCQYLRGQLDGIELIEGDAVDVLEQADFRIDAPYKVVSNLPYNISTPILERLVEREDKPRAMILTVQREVAHRLAATPRHKDYGALTVFTQLWYHVTVAHIISPRCFYPAPKVDSAIVVLERRDPRVKLRVGARFTMSCARDSVNAARCCTNCSRRSERWTTRLPWPRLRQRRAPKNSRWNSGLCSRTP